MKKCFLILLILLPTFVWCQEQFVEVTLEDSIHIEPDEIYFTLMLDDETDSIDSTSDVQVKPINQPPDNGNRIDKLNQLIKKMNIEVVEAPQFAITRETYEFSNTVKTLKFRSKTKLSEFIKQARMIPGIMGSITSLKSSEFENRSNEISGKLLEKCKAKAALIAKQAHKNLGSIQQVKEENGEPKGGWTMYPPLSALFHQEMGTNEQSIIIWKKMTVRMEWR